MQILCISLNKPSSKIIFKKYSVATIEEILDHNLLPPICSYTPIRNFRYDTPQTGEFYFLHLSGEEG